MNKPWQIGLFYAFLIIIIPFSIIFADDRYTLSCDANVCRITKGYGLLGIGKFEVDKFKQTDVAAYRYNAVRVSLAGLRYSKFEPHYFYTLHLKLKDGREVNTYQCSNKNTVALSLAALLILQSQPVNEVSNYPSAIGKMFWTVHK